MNQSGGGRCAALVLTWANFGKKTDEKAGCAGPARERQPEVSAWLAAYGHLIAGCLVNAFTDVEVAFGKVFGNNMAVGA